jgi:hypothetical protein
MTDEARELMLYIENDGQIYRQMVLPVLKNLATKKAKGTYVHDLGIKAFMNVATLGAQNYHREHGSMGTPWNVMFSTSVRKEVAEALASQFLQEYRLGNFSNLLPKKYQ